MQVIIVNFLKIWVFILKGFLHRKLYGVKMFQSKDINIWSLDFVFVWLPYYRHAIPVYESQTLLTSIYEACLAKYRSQTSKHSPTGRKWIRSSNVNFFCLEHFYTIRYNTFLHTFFMLYNISKVSFLCRNPFNDFKIIPFSNFNFHFPSQN